MKCPMYDSCTLRNGGCLASLPDNGCYWYRFFKDLIQKTENPWHTGTPTEEGWYLIKIKSDDEIIYDTDKLIQCLWGLDWKYAHQGQKILAWQKINEGEN